VHSAKTLAAADEGEQAVFLAVAQRQFTAGEEENDVEVSQVVGGNLR
jgi:hypothetical protein